MPPICRHNDTDPTCSRNGGYASIRDYTQAKDREIAELRRQLAAASPKNDDYDVVDAVRVGAHLVMKVRYPNCANCAYEGVKVMVFLDARETDAYRWRVIDPHFREAKEADPRGRAAPPPAARFPATPEGWQDALDYASRKAGAR